MTLQWCTRKKWKSPEGWTLFLQKRFPHLVFGWCQNSLTSKSILYLSFWSYPLIFVCSVIMMLMRSSFFYTLHRRLHVRLRIKSLKPAEDNGTSALHFDDYFSFHLLKKILWHDRKKVCVCFLRSRMIDLNFQTCTPFFPEKNSQ